MNPRQNNQPQWLLKVIIVGVIVVFGYYVAAVLPRANAYKSTFTTLRPETVRSIRLHTEDLVAGKIVTKERILSPADISTFLSLLSAATSHSPNHPRGGWTCFAEISTTTDIPLFSFSIHATANDGVQIPLSSNGRDGWNYGTLRNDALKPFIEALFHNTQ